MKTPVMADMPVMAFFELRDLRFPTFHICASRPIRQAQIQKGRRTWMWAGACVAPRHFSALVRYAAGRFFHFRKNGIVNGDDFGPSGSSHHIRKLSTKKGGKAMGP